MLAYSAVVGMRCDGCGRNDGLRPIPTEKGVTTDRDVTWDDGTVVRVSQYRCLYCGAREAVQGVWNNDHQKDERKGGTLPSDGRMFIPHKPDE